MGIHFIIGIGRSGTTLLTLLLKKQDAFDAQGDIPFIIFFYNQLKNKKSISPKNRDQILSYFNNFQLNQDQKNSLQNYLKSTNNYDTYNQLSKQIIFTLSNKKSEFTLIDKEPSYTLHIQRLINTFPESKFIYMIRDYRGNYLSRKQNKNNRTTNIYYNNYRWYNFNKRGLKSMKKHADKILIVKYEDLAIQTDDELNRIADFLQVKNKLKITDIDYEDHIIKNNVNQEFKEQLKEKINEQINTSRVDAWKKQLTKKEIEICESVCSKIGIEFGYTSTLPNKTHFSLFWWLLAKYDFYKEFILMKLPISWKLKRLNKINGRK